MNNRVMLPITLFLNSFFSVAYLQLTVPLLSTMVAAQGFTNPSLIGLIATLPSLALIPTVLLCGKLAETMSKKTLFYIGVIIFLIGGIGAIFTKDIVSLLVCRAIVGLGSGFCILLVTGLIPDYYEGHALENMMGIVVGGAGVLGFVQANLAGLLGATSWQTAYWLHLLAIIPMLMVMFFLPSKPTVTAAQGAPGEKAPLAPVVYLYFLVCLIIFMSMMVLWTQVSVFIAAENLGSVASAGLAASLISAFSFVGSILFGKLFGTLKQFTIATTIACATIGFFIVATAGSFPMVLAGIAFYGFAMGLLAPVLLTKAVLASPKSQAFAQSIVLVGIFLGQFGSTFWLQLTNAVFGSTSLRSAFLTNGIFLAIVLVISLLVAFRGNKKPAAA